MRFIRERGRSYLRKRRLVKAGVFDDLVDAMDRLIASGAGGLSSRSDVINEALDAYITESTLDWNNATDSQLATTASNRAPDGPPEASGRGQPIGVLQAPEVVNLMTDGLGKVNAGPLFFHNRDYPSLWSAMTIADLTREQPLAFDQVLKETTQLAWRFAEGLRQLNMADLKPTVLFPTNREKRDASEAAFRAFAIGSCSRNGETISCSGPLFVWGVCQVKIVGNDLVVGITPVGFDLLRSLNGLNAQMPHSARFAATFFEFLKRHAPDDWWGFQTVCRLVQDKPNRELLLNSFSFAAQQKHYEWTAHQVANYVSGYVSRAREWGLLAPKQIVGRYGLTVFGESTAAAFEGASA